VFPFSEGTVQLKGWISRQMDKWFRELVVKKYGIFIRGHFSYEIEQALIHYMHVKPRANRAHTHMSLAVGEGNYSKVPLSTLNFLRLI
jgi:hypothetical protein